MKCEYHLCGNETQTRFCCYACKNKYHVDLRRKKLKVMAVEYKGGKCQNCGYNKSYAAIQFHHRDPKTKSFSLAHPNTRSWEKVKAELDKCDIVCSNCHAEIENKPYEFKYELIKNNVKFKSGPAIGFVKLPKKETRCVDCNKIISNNFKRCKPCHSLTYHSSKPDKEWLSQLIYMMPFSQIGELYGVTDNSVRKWCKGYKIEIPKFGAGYWLKKERIKVPPGKFELPT